MQIQMVQPNQLLGELPPWWTLGWLFCMKYVWATLSQRVATPADFCSRTKLTDNCVWSPWRWRLEDAPLRTWQVNKWIRPDSSLRSRSRSDAQKTHATCQLPSEPPLARYSTLAISSKCWEGHSSQPLNAVDRRLRQSSLTFGKKRGIFRAFPLWTKSIINLSRYIIIKYEEADNDTSMWFSEINNTGFWKYQRVS